MNGKLSEEEIKNLEELINSDDLECVMLANEIVSTLDSEVKFKYNKTICSNILRIWFKNSNYEFNPPWFFE